MRINHDILVSIIVPTYNVEDYISNTIKSIFLNGYLDCFELIIVDDGSTDMTVSYIEDCLRQWQFPNVIFVQQSNKGVSAARNEGIKRANGRYLIFCDGDDFCYPSLIETIKDELIENRDMFIWGYDITQEGRRDIAFRGLNQKYTNNVELISKLLLGEYKIRMGSFAVRKEFLYENNLFFTEGCAIGEDIEFIYKCVSIIKQWGFINKILFTYEKRKGSAMYSYRMDRFEASRAIKRIYEFILSKSTVVVDPFIADYMKNGFYILHSIYAFDSVILYLRNWSDVKKFWREYNIQYPDVEKHIMEAKRDMKIRPIGISDWRVYLFCKNRILYIIVMKLRNRLMKWKK